MDRRFFHILATIFLLFTAFYFFSNNQDLFKEKEDQKKEEKQEEGKTKEETEQKKETQHYNDCNIQKGQKEVRGSSMSPLIESGQIIEVLFSYYDCNDVQRDDLVLYSYAGNDVPLLKQAKGIPTDHFELKKRDDSWNVYINGEVLKNSENIPYSFSGKRYDMLSLYEKNFEKNIIPEATYLLLGDSHSSVMDSSRFGFVHKNDIIAKALKK